MNTTDPNRVQPIPSDLLYRRLLDALAVDFDLPPGGASAEPQVVFRMAHNHDQAALTPAPSHQPAAGPGQCCPRHALAAWRAQAIRLGYITQPGRVDQDRITRRLAELDTPPIAPRFPVRPLLPATRDRIAAGIARYSRTA